ncbi:tetratricopeptidedomain 39C [Angomonas deanei]|nr:tetratricopeptidedomain 39C [Angomonas deanei]|eukprot:EPY29727.1 tetratricopeptidedomain 39C [Angomonas deanei]
MQIIKELMSSQNDKREATLEFYKIADTLASATKYNEPMFEVDDEDEVPDSPEKDALKSKRELAKEKKKKKKAFKSNLKAAEKSGQSFNDIWKLECDVIYADALLVRAIIQLMMNSYLKGGINLRKAWGCYHTLIDIVEKDTEKRIPRELEMCIKFGAGLFYTFLALVPANLMKLLSIIGFISDKDLGEQYLTEVFESNSIRSPHAALILCTLYLFLPTGLGDVNVALDRAKRVLETMNERYPQNTYFLGIPTSTTETGDTAPAVNCITVAADNAERVGLVPLLIRYLHADTLFMDQQWKDALQKYLALLDYFKKENITFAYTGQIVLSVAACYVMTGNSKEAMSWIQKVQTMFNPKSKNDSVSPRFAKRVIANPRLLPLSAVYMLYINRDLAHMNNEQGLRVKSEMKRVIEGADLSGPEAENMRDLFFGVIEKGIDNKEEAAKLFKGIISKEKTIPQELMILPFTYYELGELEYRRGDLKKAKELFEKGSKIKGDGNDTLSNRYSIALKQLKRKMEESTK